MKKIIPLVLLLVLALSGCGFGDSIAEVKQQYIDPAISEARTGSSQREDAAEAILSEYNVGTDRTKLSAFEASGSVGNRLSENYISTLVTSGSYGRLMPFISSWIYGTDGSRLGAKYGLLSGDGTVVLDGVLSGVYPLDYVDTKGELFPLGIFELVKYDPETGVKKSAVCGVNGGWTTDFLYTEVIPMPIGVLCISDANENLAVCIGKDGTKLFDTANFAMRANMAPGSVSNMADYGNDYMRMEFTNGQYGFINMSGEILNHGAEYPAYYTENRAFSEGKAVISIGDSWRYLAVDGKYAFDTFYEEAYSFVGGLAVVRTEGILAIINAEGAIIQSFPGVSQLVLYPTYVLADGAYLSRDKFEPIQVEGIAATPYSGGFWVAADGGIFVRNSSLVTVFLSGATELLESSGQLWLVRLADGSTAVLDANSRTVAVGENLQFVYDSMTSDVYALEGDRLLSEDGRLLADGLILSGGSCALRPVGGMSFCEDGYSVGWKNSENSWIYRQKLDPGD